MGSLIEVLVSLLLLSIVLFGLDAMQVYSLKEAKTTYLLSVAMNQINNASERLYALKTYEGLNEQIVAWNEENKRLLPMGFGTIVGEFPDYVVMISWGNSKHRCSKQQIGQSGCLRKKMQLASH